MTHGSTVFGDDETTTEAWAEDAHVRHAAAALIVHIDGLPLAVAGGTLVAAALAIAQPGRGTRVSRIVERRQAFCGMGICGECRVRIDGGAHRLGCQVVCVDGMEIRTDG